MPTLKSLNLAQRLDLVPFLAVALFGIGELVGWWTGQVNWVQPRPYDVPIGGNTAFALLLLGAAPVLSVLDYRKLAQALALVAGVIGSLSLIDALFGLGLGIDDVLVRHQTLIEGAGIGRMPTAVAGVVLGASVLLGWHFSTHPHANRPMFFALFGSCVVSYGFAALLAGQIGLAGVESWGHHAHVGPHTAAAIMLLGLAFLLLARRDPSQAENLLGARWLWQPVVVAGATISLLFWFSLREREVAYVNNTTQLTINNIATLFSGELGAQTNSLERLAARWNDSGGMSQASWEKDVQARTADFSAYRFLCWVGPDFRTRWLWPESGNEEISGLDHSSAPLRREAMAAARGNSPGYAVAAPLVNPLQPPSFALYLPVMREGAFDGFLVGELSYAALFEMLERRLNLSSRYSLTASVARDSGALAPAPNTVVYAGSSSGEPVSARLHQSATFNVFAQRLTLELTPRAGFIAGSRQHLPEVALFAGLTGSALLGLIVNLARVTLLRQRAAERTSEQLRAENEERRRVEARLTVADERLNLALDATEVGVFEWDVPSGKIICSASLWAFLGYDPDGRDASYQAWLDLMHPDDVEGFKSAVTAHFQGQSAFIEPEYRMHGADHSWVWIAARAKCVAWDSTGGPQRVTGTCQNINARRRAEDALRASQAAARLLTHVARRTENVVFITTPLGNIQWTNDSFTRLTGHAANEVAGCYLLDLLASPDSAPHALDQITQALLHVSPITTEVMAKSRFTDRSYHLRLELQPVKNDRGEAENFIAIGTDITTSVQTEANLRRAKLEADTASRAKSDFLATMSHEIRTPMNGVIGMTSLLLETELSVDQRDYVNTIRTSGNALLDVINEILDFSKIESGRMEIEYQPFEIAQCIEEAMDIFALQAAAKNIELAYLIDPATPAWISLDMTRVRQVLVNLVNNAVKFTVQGQITIEVKPALVPSSDRAAPPLQHREGDRQMIDFCVRDTGIGIPADRRHLLFKPFSQVDSSTTRKYGGTGLGLAICDRLCQLMGGTIDVASNPGGGSVFRFSILAASADQSLGLPVAQLPAKFQDALVLVVDDLPFNRILLRQALASRGLRAVEAAHLHDATEIAMEQPIVAAIIDQELMGETGITLAEVLRTRRPEVPVLLLTNPIEAARRVDSTDPYLIRLPKPIKPALLLETLNRLLGGSRPGFNFSMPATPDENISQLASAIPLEILLVEDNPVNQKVALRLLERLGYVADAVGNGLEALHTLDQRKYDLVLMDIQMPEMDGLTATREIRQRYPAHRQPRVVALTANAVEGDRERCLDAGMDDYLSKPVKLEGIQQLILKYFRGVQTH